MRSYINQLITHTIPVCIWFCLILFIDLLLYICIIIYYVLFYGEKHLACIILQYFKNLNHIPQWTLIKTGVLPMFTTLIKNLKKRRKIMHVSINNDLMRYDH